MRRLVWLMMFALTAGPAQAADAPPGPLPSEPDGVELFHAVTLDRAAGHVDVRGRVIGGPVEWLELLACRPGTREHESVVTLDARAEHLHAALLLMGLTPGTPADARWEGDTLVQTPPRGPEVGVLFVFDGAPDRPVPAGAYVADQATGAPLDPAVPGAAAGGGVEATAGGGWRFTGSRLVEGRQRTYFLAEENGTLISLVNFGDDLIARDTPHPADGGNGFWTLNPEPAGWPALPAPGTPLTVRLAAVPDPDAAPAPAPAPAPALAPGPPDNPAGPDPQR